MENVLDRAKSLGIKFDKKLDRLAELQELLHVAECQRTGLDEKGEDTSLHDVVIEKVREAIDAESEQVR